MDDTYRKIFAQAKVIEQDRDLINESISIEGISVLETGYIQPRSLNEKMIISKR